jgi:hypothetical protein
MPTSTVPTYVPFPPKTSQVNTPNGNPSGTITGIAGGGPANFTLTNAAGEFMMAMDQPAAFNVPVSLAFTGGAPSVTQTTPSAIQFTFQ